MKFTSSSECEVPGSHTRAASFPVKFILFTVVLMVSVTWLGCTKSDPRAAGRGVAPIVSVSVAAAQRQDMPVYFNGLGSVTAYYTVSVKSRVDGQLVEVRFKEGQFVRQGDLLAVIDPRPYEVQLNQAQATLFRDQAQLRDAKLNYDRFKGLLQESGAMSQQQVDTQKAMVDQLEGTVRTDQASIDNVKLQLTYCHITAPVSGRIGLRQVDPGNMVHAADANPMFVVTQLQPIAVIFTLPEDNLPIVARRLAQGQLLVDAYSRDNQTKLATGKLESIDNQIDQTTGTGRLKAVFTNKDDALWPNQFVNARLLVDVRKNATVLPAAAIQRGPQGTYVYVMNADKKVDLRPVTVALIQDQTAAIQSGVSAGDIVVTDGQDKLQAGSTVEPRGLAPPGNRQAQGSPNRGEGGPPSGRQRRADVTQPGDKAQAGTAAQ